LRSDDPLPVRIEIVHRIKHLLLDQQRSLLLGGDGLQAPGKGSAKFAAASSFPIGISTVNPTRWS
jgi:hypothetical protein